MIWTFESTQRFYVHDVSELQFLEDLFKITEDIICHYQCLWKI